MKSFHFPLERALAWRRAQLDLAEARLQQQIGALAEIDRMRRQLATLGRRTEVEVRGFSPLSGDDLTALGTFRLSLRSQQRQLLDQRAATQKELVVRQAALREARRRFRLLERLKERRWAEWKSAVDRELEELASDSYLSKWARNAQHGRES